jgi:hypothetical protein
MITKEEAGYIEHMDTGDRRCSTCDMYTTGTCSLVIGLIEPYGGCKFYEPKNYDRPAVGQVVMVNESPRL